MDEQHKKQYLEKYQRMKQKGVKFFPDIIYKDMIVSFGFFILLVCLAVFLGVASEPKADPNDNAYIPRPEWYFLFLFQMLKYFPGKIEWIGTTLVPGLAVLVLLALPFIDRSPFRYWRKRKLAISLMTIAVAGIVALTVIAAVTTPPQTETGTTAGTLAEKITAGSDLFSVNCTECHGPEGEGGEIKGVSGLEGVVVRSISDKELIYNYTDETLSNIISQGFPSSGMPPFSKASGGELGPGDIEAIVTFMRYTWDDRVELPPEAIQAAAIPTLAVNEVPSYDVQIAPIIKRYCISCHRPGKKNNNYLMGSYEEVIQSGDHAPNIVAGDLNSNLIRMIHREKIEAGGPMPPTRPLSPELVQIIDRWVSGGMPQTAEEAAKLTPAAALTTTLTTTLTAPLAGTPGVTSAATGTIPPPVATSPAGSTNPTP